MCVVSSRQLQRSDGKTNENLAYFSCCLYANPEIKSSVISRLLLTFILQISVVAQWLEHWAIDEKVVGLIVRFGRRHCWVRKQSFTKDRSLNTNSTIIYSKTKSFLVLMLHPIYCILNYLILLFIRHVIHLNIEVLVCEIISTLKVLFLRFFLLFKILSVYKIKGPRKKVKLIGQLFVLIELKVCLIRVTKLQFLISE